jgi:ferritin-like protein
MEGRVMTESSKGFHEPVEALRDETREFHRGLASLVEELEAIDWYQQRIDATEDDDLRGLLIHNRDEEMEHAAMALEWLRRRDDVLDGMLRRYLFTEGPIAGIEEGNDPSKRESAGRSGRGAERSLEIGIPPGGDLNG